MSDIDDLEQKIARLESALEKDIYQAVHKQGLRVQQAAKMNCPVRRYGAGGGLRQSIFIATEKKEDSVESEVYTDLPYAQCVEFGTGPTGQEKHTGISPEVHPVYSQEGWMMPASAMSLEEAEEYGFGIARKGEDVIGYYTNGQAAQPFLYPALNDLREDIIKDLGKELGELLK